MLPALTSPRCRLCIACTALEWGMLVDARNSNVLLHETGTGLIADLDSPPSQAVEWTCLISLQACVAA